MKTRTFMHALLITLFVGYSFGLSANTPPQEEEAMRAFQEARRMEYEALIEEAELKRQLATEAAKEAQLALKQVEEQARMEAAELETEKAVLSAEQAREAALEAEELSIMREELSRAHRELREVSRQVAQAHRELVVSDVPRHRVRHINLGDRAVIGVILGRETDQGLEIIGVSPDGPADQAGMLAGDVMVSIAGIDLQGDEAGRDAVYRVMDEVEDGEELDVTVLRNQELVDLTVTAERREPTAWQSLIRIPESPESPAAPQHHVVIKRIEMPEIDQEAFAAEVAELQKQVEGLELPQIDLEAFSRMAEGEWAFELGDMSEFGMDAIRQADVWFGLPLAHGLELATLNPELGEYFDAASGVLVIRAKPDNAYELRSGDVVLEINATPVNTPSDLMRALRELDSGESADVFIKRDKRDVTLKVIVPENRLTFERAHHGDDH